MGYNGWTLYDEVTLVIKDESCNRYRYKYPQAFVVNTKDKKQLETARKWGTEVVPKRDKNGDYIEDTSGKHVYETLKPTEVTLKNSGFNLTLYDTAGSSSQGGKLSFWNCLIEHEEHNIKCIIGIDSNLLLNVLLQNKFDNGKCLDTLSFARCSGSVGLLNENMKEYKEALKDNETKKSLSKGKTNKYQIGHIYSTLTKDDYYFGSLYTCINIDRHTKYELSGDIVNLDIFADGNHQDIY